MKDHCLLITRMQNTSSFDVVLPTLPTHSSLSLACITFPSPPSFLRYPGVWLCFHFHPFTASRILDPLSTWFTDTSLLRETQGLSSLPHPELQSTYWISYLKPTSNHENYSNKHRHKHRSIVFVIWQQSILFHNLFELLLGSELWCMTAFLLTAIGCTWWQSCITLAADCLFTVEALGQQR